jgi:hypothetical protein
MTVAPAQSPSRRVPDSAVRLDGECLVVERLRTTAGRRRRRPAGAVARRVPGRLRLDRSTVGAKAIAMAGGVSGVDAVAARIDALAAQVAGAAERAMKKVQRFLASRGRSHVAHASSPIGVVADRMAGQKIGAAVAGRWHRRFA